MNPILFILCYERQNLSLRFEILKQSIIRNKINDILVYIQNILISKAKKLDYSIELGENFDQRVPFLDFALVPGDTLHKFTPRRYHIIIDKRLGPEGEDVFFVLRRTRRGISDLEERQIWVISAISGIMAVAKYQIDPFNGSVTLEMIGDSEWFRDSNLTRRIKLYDYTRTIYMDRDRSLLYEFNKIGGFIRVRDVKAREEIFRYDFSNKGLRNLVNFSLRPEVSGVTLQAEDSCYRFSESLQLVSSGICRD